MIFSSRRGRITDAAHPAATEVDQTTAEVAGCLMPRAVTAAFDAAGSVRLVLISRQRCHLCVLAQEVIEATVSDSVLSPDQIVVLDVDADEDLRTAHTAHVPVVYLDRRLLAYWQLPAEKLRAALADPGWTSPPPL